MERPILFNTEMVKAILEGRKTQTRRIIKPQPINLSKLSYGSYIGNSPDGNSHIFKPLYQVGDILWVRETWTKVTPFAEDGTWDYDNEKLYYYANSEDRKAVNEIDYCDGDGFLMHKPFPWHPSIHMPRKAARIFLKITNVKVQRVQDITPDECLKEGIKGYSFGDNAPNAYGDNLYTDPKLAFKALWNSTIKKDKLNIYGWDANPWVWVYEFKRMEGYNAKEI